MTKNLIGLGLKTEIINSKQISVKLTKSKETIAVGYIKVKENVLWMLRP